MTPEPVTVAERRRLAAAQSQRHAIDAYSGRCDYCDEVWPCQGHQSSAALSAAADEIERLERVRKAAIAALETQTLSMYPAFVILDAERVRSLRGALLAAASDARAGEGSDG